MRTALLLLACCFCLLAVVGIWFIHTQRDVDIRLHFYFGPQKSLTADSQ
jgi:hypothetical protein